MGEDIFMVVWSKDIICLVLFTPWNSSLSFNKLCCCYDLVQNPPLPFPTKCQLMRQLRNNTELHCTVHRCAVEVPAMHTNEAPPPHQRNVYGQPCLFLHYAHLIIYENTLMPD